MMKLTMKIIYPYHAKKRMKQRGIENWEIEYLLGHPKYMRRFYGETKEAIGEIKDRIVKVVFVELENYIKIVTVGFL